MATHARVSVPTYRADPRISEDWRRTGDGDRLRMPKDLRPKSPANGRWAKMPVPFLVSAGERGGRLLRSSCSPTRPSRRSSRLGFPLPGDLRQLYLEIGDGGFGPYNGVRRLSNWMKDYQKLRAEPIGEKQRAWPAELLPIVYLNGHRVCMSRNSGAIVRWTKPPARCSEAKWTGSFAPQSSSLAEWLERWVDTPTQIEGGPEGGWSPSATESERRQRAETDQQARLDAATEKARTFVVADLPPLPEALIERVRERACDPRRRTFLASAAGATIGLDDVEDELVRAADAIPRQAISGLAGMLNGLRRWRRWPGGMAGWPWSAVRRRDDDEESGTGGRLGAPADPAAFAHAAGSLGFDLCRAAAALRDRRRRVRPGRHRRCSASDLLTRLPPLTGARRDRRASPGRRRLLPLYESDPALGCLDLGAARWSSTTRADGRRAGRFLAAIVRGRARVGRRSARGVAGGTQLCRPVREG